MSRMHDTWKHLRKRNHKCFKLENDKSNAGSLRCALDKDHFHFGFFWQLKGLETFKCGKVVNYIILHTTKLVHDIKTTLYRRRFNVLTS